MLAKFKITIVFILSSIALNAQVVLNLDIVTANKKPIPFSIVKYEALVQSTNELGFLRINNYKWGEKISIKKLGFTDTTIIFNQSVAKDTLSVIIVLKSKIIVLDEVPVYSNNAIEINPRRSSFILDYELYGESVVELLSSDNVLLINKENRVKCIKKVGEGTEDLIKDFYGNVNLVTSVAAFKTKMDSFKIVIDTMPISLEKFNWAIKYCDGALDTMIFVRRYKDINQTVTFFAISNLHNTQFKLLKEISDANKRRAVRAHAGKVNGLIIGLYDPNNLAGDMGDLDIAGIERRRKVERLTWEQKMLYDAPSYNVLKLMNDSIYIFGHDIDTLFIFDKACNLIRSNYIDYHHLKSWGGEIIMNEEKTKVYGKFASNKNIMVAEINLTNGQLKLPFFKIESGHSPKKIRIRGNTIYYLGKQPDGVGSTVYSQDLQL